jgi:hypothetical protein
MTDFKFSPAATPQTQVEVALGSKFVDAPATRDAISRRKNAEPKQPRVATTGVSDAERIASAKARHMARVKENNLPGAQYGFGYLPEYFKDGCGVETSTYDFNHLMFILGFLHDPKFEYLSHNHRDGDYNSFTGVWTGGTSSVSIQELKQAVAERIAALGISEVILLEHLAEPHSWQEDQQFYALSFDEKMSRFDQ